MKKLKLALVTRGLKGRFRACESGCLDLCEIGAAIAVEPDHVAYGNVTEGDVEEIAESLVNGTIVTRLVAFPAPFPAKNSGNEG